jgi:hypothetical protein
MNNSYIELRYGLDSFKSDWRHCSLGANFLAETAFDTAYSKQVASAVINEFLELAFRLGAAASKSWVQAMVLPGSTMALELDVIVRPELLMDVKQQLRKLQVDPLDYYQSQLGADLPGAFFGISYLVHDLSAVISTNIKANVLLVRGNVDLRVEHEN